jgi:hypothetical protein
MIFVCCNILIQQKFQASKSIQFFLLQFSLTKKLGLEIYLAFLLMVLVMINVVD